LASVISEQKAIFRQCAGGGGGSGGGGGKESNRFAGFLAPRSVSCEASRPN